MNNSHASSSPAAAGAGAGAGVVNSSSRDHRALGAAPSARPLVHGLPAGSLLASMVSIRIGPEYEQHRHFVENAANRQQQGARVHALPEVGGALRGRGAPAAPATAPLPVLHCELRPAAQLRMP